MNVAPVRVSVFQSFNLSVSLCFCLSSFLSFCLSVFLSFCLSVFLSFCLSVLGHLSSYMLFLVQLYLSIFLAFTELHWAVVYWEAAKYYLAISFRLGGVGTFQFRLGKIQPKNRYLFRKRQFEPFFGDFLLFFIFWGGYPPLAKLFLAK